MSSQTKLSGVLKMMMFTTCIHPARSFTIQRGYHTVGAPWARSFWARGGGVVIWIWVVFG